MKKIHRCNYAHMGECSDQLTHRVDYWLGEARKKFGRYAFFCAAHSRLAGHLRLEQIQTPEKAQP